MIEPLGPVLVWAAASVSPAPAQAFDRDQIRSTRLSCQVTVLGAESDGGLPLGHHPRMTMQVTERRLTADARLALTSMRAAGLTTGQPFRGVGRTARHGPHAKDLSPDA